MFEIIKNWLWKIGEQNILVLIYKFHVEQSTVLNRKKNSAIRVIMIIIRFNTKA